MSAYYNEIDAYAAQWLRNLIAKGLIADGEVDTRSISDVRSDDLRGFAQCHFFAGIGGWSIALRLAGWDDDRPVWTGSCPCQPFSAAGAGKAADDGRHLWPAWFPLIRERRPPTVFGEQVEAAIGWGWLDAVCADMEGEGYACGAAVLPACGVGAPHIRNRLWFVADAKRERERHDSGGMGTVEHETEGSQSKFGRETENAIDHSTNGIVADAESRGFGELWNALQSRRGGHVDGGFEPSRMADTERNGRWTDQPQRGSQGRITDGWSGAEFIDCTDGKARPVESGSFPLAHGVQRRTSKLRAYGNAIVPALAAEFISAHSK